MDISNKYTNYINNHTQNVKNAFEFMKLVIFPLYEEITDEIKEMMTLLIKYHDSSKWTTEEFNSYMEYFYGKGKNVEEFNYAWLHHIHNNPHHWEYWVIYQKDKSSIVLDMPIQYIIEMICDWWSFSWKKNDLFEIFTWYENNKDSIELSIKTREFVENILFELKKQLTYYPEGRPNFE